MNLNEGEPKPEIEAAEADLNLRLNTLIGKKSVFGDLQKKMGEIRDLKGIDQTSPQEFLEKYFSNPNIFDELKLTIETLEIKSGRKPPIDEEEIEQKIKRAVEEMIKACNLRENFEVVYQDIKRTEEKLKWVEENEDFIFLLDQLYQAYLSFTKSFRKIPEQPTFLTLRAFQNEIDACDKFFKSKRPGIFYTVANLAKGMLKGEQLGHILKYDQKHSQELLEQIFGESPEERKPEILIEEGVEIDFFEKGKEKEELLKLAETIIPRDVLYRMVRQIKITNAGKKFEIETLGNISGEYNTRLGRITIFRGGQSLELPHLIAHEVGHAIYLGKHLNLLERLAIRHKWIRVVFDDDVRIRSYIDEIAKTHGAKSQIRFSEDFCDSFADFLTAPSVLAEASEKRFWFMKHYMDDNFPKWDVVRRRDQIRELENCYFERVAENYNWIRRKISDLFTLPEEKRLECLFTCQEIMPSVLSQELPQQIIGFKKKGGGEIKRQIEKKGISIIYVFNEKTGLPQKIGQVIYEYNAKGKLVKRLFPDGSFDNFNYDKQGRLKEIETRNKKGEKESTAKFKYSKKGKILETWQDENKKFQRFYEYQLDKKGRVVKKKWLDNEGKSLLTISFSYGDQGEMLKKSYKDGKGNLITESKYSYSE